MLREKLASYIKENGVMRSWVAERLGISKQHLSNYLNGKHTISRELEEKVKEFLRERGEL